MATCPINNILDPNIFADGMPYDGLAELRQRGPVVYMEDDITGVPYWLVTRREELDFVERNPEIFSSQARSAMPMEDTPDMVENISSKMLINMDEPRHMKMRKVVRDAFTPRAVAKHLPFLEKHAKMVVDAVAGKGECEFVTEVAAELPLLTILHLLDVPAEDRKKFFDWTNIMFFADDADASGGQEEAAQAAAELMEYAYNLKLKYADEPKETVTGALLSGEIDGEPISDEEFLWMFLMTITAGNESTRTSITHGMRLLMEHPDQLEWLRENPDQIPSAVDEMVRYNTAFTCMRRTAMEDVEVGGQNIRKGDKVILHYHTVNHDENVFGEDATKFDVKRAQRHENLARDLRSFGTGSHFCLGTHLAKQEMRIMFEQILPRMRNPQFAGPVQYMRSYFVNGIKTMPITFTPEA
ncbi:MAG: cytochrome P450 [Halioglobus sp.]